MYSSSKPYSQTFATPNPKSRQLKKDKSGLRKPTNQRQENVSGEGLSSLGFSRSSDNVPTAHVIPSPLKSNVTTETSQSHATTISQSHVSTKNGLSKYPSEESLRVAANRHDMDTFPSDATHRWASHTDITTATNDEFHALPQDPNLTTVDFPDNKRVGMATPHHAYTRRPDTYSSYTERVYPRTQYNPQAYTPEAYAGYSSNRAYHSDRHAPSPSDHFSADLTSWQQRHQEALRRQQMEVVPQPTGHPAPSYQTPPAPSSVLLSDPHKLDAVRHAADNIIKEKDMIIDRQRLRLDSMELRTKDSELARQREAVRRAQEESDGLAVRVQKDETNELGTKEFQYENASLKAQITEYATSRKSSEAELEKKLGASEYELQRLRLRLDQETAKLRDEVSAVTDKLKVKDAAVQDWQDKLSDERRQKEALRRQVESLERYLDDVPTAEEHGRRSEEVATLRSKVMKLQEQVTDVEKRKDEVERGVKSRDGLIESLEGNERQLKERLDKAETDNHRLRERLTRDGIPVDDIEELQYENQRLRADLDKARKLLEMKHKRHQQSDARHRSEISAVEERLSQEESTVTALREEVAGKDQNLIKLRQSFKELGAQNQDLMEKNMSLQDTVSDLDRRLSGDVHKLETRLLRELTVCFTELHSLVQICVQHAEGQDPNISALLGVKASVTGEPEPDSETSDVASLKFKVGKVRDMRNEVDKLREIISNKYAEEMGDNLNCTTQ